MSFLMNSLTLAWKDLKVLFKDRGELAVIFVMPLMFALIFGAPTKIAEDIDEPGAEPALVISTYVVNLDSGLYGEQVTAALGTVKTLDLKTADTADEADEKVADGEAVAAIVIPADFSQRIDANQPVKVRLIKDPTEQAEAEIVVGIMRGAMAELSTRAELEYGIRAVWESSGALEGADPEFVRAAQAQTMGAIWTQVQQMRQNPIIRVRTENLAGEVTQDEFNPFPYLMPMFSTMFAFFLVGTMAESILKEKTSGSFRRLLAAPIPRGSIIAGKMEAYIIVVFLQMILLFAVGYILFDMPLGDSPLGIILLTLSVALAATSLGMLVGSVARTSRQAGTIGLVLGFVLYGASGSMMSGTDFGSIGFRSEGFQYYLSRITPHAHSLDGYLKLMAEGGSLVDILPNVAALLLFAAVFFAAAMRRFRFEA
jgi:ABC-2 type transport system permease protein